jgi:signal peptidase I
VTDQVDRSQPPDGGSPPERRRERQRQRPQSRSAASGALSLVREAAIVVVAAVVLSLVVKTFLVQAFFIPSESMENTLLIGDRVLVSELTPGPFDLHRGDVVVFKDPGSWLPPAVEPDRGPVTSALVSALTFIGILPQDSSQHLIKRVIGLPGDTVACCDAQQRTTVNGAPITESYLFPGSVASEVPFSVKVPAGDVWVEGDNRQHSEDSRYHQDLPGGGALREKLIVGRAVVRVWPVPRWGWLSDHGEVFARVPDPS